MEATQKIMAWAFLGCGGSISVLILGLAIYLYSPYWKVRKIPGPPFKFLVGHLPLLAKYGPDIFKVLAKEYGPVYRFHMGRQPLVIVADPELCREVGIKKFKYLKNRSTPSPVSGSPIHERGLFLSRDSKWASMRNVITPFYQPTHIASLVPVIQSLVESATRRLAEEEELNFSLFSLKLAVDVIGRTAFGFNFDLSAGEASTFLKQHIFSTESLKMDLSGSFSSAVGLVAPFLQSFFKWVMKKIPTTADHEMHRTTEALVEVVSLVVNNKLSEEEDQPSDFLSAMLRSEICSIEDINALTFEHLIAGSATTSFTLSSVIYLVSKHKEVEKKLLQEIDAFAALARAPTAEDLGSMFPYLDQVVKEAMRYYTASPLVARETSQEIQIGRYIIPEGSWVWLALGVLAKDSNNFPRPDEFRPERFEPGGQENRIRHPYAHIPFGIGPRICIGHRLALIEIKLFLVQLYRSFVFKLSPLMEDPPELTYGVVLGFKNGIRVLPVRRWS